MSFDLGRAVSELEEFVSGYEPKLYSPADSVTIYEVAVKGERLFKALKIKAQKQAEASQAWRRLGFQNVDEWLAHMSGSSTYAATQERLLADDLDEAPATKEAFERGEISADQAATIADAAKTAPDSEGELLGSAKAKTPLNKLKAKAGRAKARARTPEDEEARQRRIHAERGIDTWNTNDGAFDGRWHLTKKAGATVMAALEPYLKAAYAKAHGEGRHETRRALLADALVAMATDKAGGGKGPRPVINIRVDYGVLRRGYPTEGEMCEIEGFGSIPLALVADMASDAVLRILLLEGKDVKVAASARSATALQRVLLKERADHGCDLRTCTRKLGLQVDHVVDWAKGGLTALDNEQLLCRWHHYLKTHKGYRYVRADDGEFDVVAPEGADPEPDPPPEWDSG
jgi:hypothetical protein